MTAIESTPPPRRTVPTAARVAAVVGAALVAGLAIAAALTPPPQQTVDEAFYDQFCTPVPPAAVVAAAVPADHRIDVRVPPVAGAPDLERDSHATPIGRGNVVEIRITAPIAGAASVHGLSDLVVMRAGESATLRFRAIYSGRFPLHFHGADGSHYGVWALDITARTPS